MRKVKMVDLVAVKPLTYATRRLRAGDTFSAAARHAEALKIVGKAADAPVAPKVNAVPAPDPLEALRARYGELSGQEANKRWGEARLQKEIAYLSMEATDDAQNDDPQKATAANDALADQVEGSAPASADDGLPL